MQESPLASQTKNAVEQYIAALMAKRQNEASAIHPRYELLWENIKKISTDGGKRLRPYLTMVGYGEFSNLVIPIASAQELIHIAMLIHDDIIDQDNVRHGSKNISGIYDNEYSQYLNKKQSAHYASSSALVAGDALIAEAHLSIAVSSFDQNTVRQLTERLHQSVFEVVGGELLDVEAAFMRFDLDPQIICRYKTAGYSFIGPLLSGAICQKADEWTKKSLEQYGLNAGIAFQLQDDLLGMFGDEKKIGKSKLTDLHEAKYTLLIAEHRRMMSGAMKQRFSKNFASDSATLEDLLQLKHDIKVSGARDKIEGIIKIHVDNALRAIQSVNQSTELENFTKAMMNRYL